MQDKSSSTELFAIELSPVDTLSRLAELDDKINQLERQYYQQLGAKEQLANNKAEIVRLCKEANLDPKYETIQKALEDLTGELVTALKTMEDILKEV